MLVTDNDFGHCSRSEQRLSHFWQVSMDFQNFHFKGTMLTFEIKQCLHKNVHELVIHCVLYTQLMHQKIVKSFTALA